MDSSSGLSGAAAGGFEESEPDSFDAVHQLPQPDSGKIIPRANASHVVRFMTVSCLAPNGRVAVGEADSPTGERCNYPLLALFASSPHAHFNQQGPSD